MLGQTVAAKRADGGCVVFHASSSNAGVTQVNKSFDSHYDAQASYGQRMTRWMPWLGLVVGLVLGAFGVRRRRLEYAGALHSGQSKGAQLLEIAVETLIWSLFGRAVGCVLRSHEHRRFNDRMVGCDARAMCDIRWSDGIKRARRYDDT